jgi:hypothetical protein
MTHTHNKFIDTVLDSHNIDPLGIYCSVTGKMLGYMLNDEVYTFLDSRTDIDLEQLADDWAMRLIASMRPSPNWNVMREETLDQMARSHPVETFAYLFNRLTSTPDHHAIPLSQRTTQMLARIANYETIKAAHDSEGFDKMLQMLLEVDAVRDLAKQEIPFESIDWRNAGFEERTRLITEWYQRECREYIKRRDESAAQARWEKHGNPVASRAAAKKAMLLKIELDGSMIRRGQKTKQKQAEKNKQDAFFAGLFDAIQSGKSVVETPDKPSAKPATTLKLKLNLGGRA